MDITVSIVTYNSGPIIGTCLDHLKQSTRRNIQIVVSDNCSQDDTLAVLANRPDRTQVINHRQNLGFGHAHNTALAHAPGRYYLILNPDITLPPGSLDQLADHLDQHKECGAVAPLLQEGNGHLSGSTRSYPSQRYVPELLKPLQGEIAALQGACLLVRASTFRKIGGFDPGFFLYAEDLDLSLEIRRQGYELHCLESIRVPHLSGHSERFNSTRAVSAKKYLGLLLFFRKHYPRRARGYLIIRDGLKAAFRLLALMTARSPDRIARREEYRGRLQAMNAYFHGIYRL